MLITPIIINGRHGGIFLPNMEYYPTIKLPINNKCQISLGENYDNSVRIGDIIEYKECFRSVDKRCVMYSTNGRWDDIKYALLSNIEHTYPINIFNFDPQERTKKQIYKNEHGRKLN
jgi:hypothetical protein